MDKALIKSATDKLHISDVVLHESSLFRNNNVDPIAVLAMDIRQQNKLEFRAEDVEYDGENKSHKLFRVYVDFGVRAIYVDEQENPPGDIEDEDEDVIFTIEATYRVDYFLKGDLSNEEAEEFSKYNAVHNAWPFWRMHVFNIIKLALLPQLNIPLQLLDRD